MSKAKVIIKNKNEISDEPVKKRFFRKRKFKDPILGLIFESGSTYQENKDNYYKALELVFTGKCKTLFEAHKIYS